MVLRSFINNKVILGLCRLVIDLGINNVIPVRSNSIVTEVVKSTDGYLAVIEVGCTDYEGNSIEPLHYLVSFADNQHPKCFSYMLLEGKPTTVYSAVQNGVMWDGLIDTTHKGIYMGCLN